MSVIDVTRLSEQQVGVSREFDDFRTRPVSPVYAMVWPPVLRRSPALGNVCGSIRVSALNGPIAKCVTKTASTSPGGM